jgi:hypothetical protein
MSKKMIFIPFFFVGMAALITWILMLLWNWLMPLIFDLTTITFWQALGLLIMSKILFGGFGGGKKGGKWNGSHSGGGWKHKFKHKWANMSGDDKMKWESKFAGTPYSAEAMNDEDSKSNKAEENEAEGE